jgi:hypothetical protein
MAFGAWRMKVGVDRPIRVRQFKLAQKVAHGSHLGLTGVQHIHGLAEVFAARQVAHGPADVLARGAHTGQLAVEAVVVQQVLQHPGAHVLCGRWRKRRAGVEKVCDLAEDPRPALRRAADHQRVCFRVAQHGQRLGTTGTRSVAFTAAIVSYSARPV